MRNERPTTATGRRLSPLRAGVALIVSALCQLGQVNASVHEIAVRHVICADHGELAHAGRSSGPASPDGPPAVQTDRSVNSHEHCPLPGLLGRHATVPAVQQGADLVVQLAVSSADSGRSVAPGTRLLLSAPKTSPPRA